MEQLAVYIGFYTDKAKSLVRQKIAYKLFSDSIMECKDKKESKQGNFVSDGGRQQPIGKHEDQQ